MNKNYNRQDRGDLEAYARYLSSMDAAMRQKVALTAAHLPCQGRVADMGMGSGSGSYALAALYPRLRVVGVDVNPTMVEFASQNYRLPNLEFRVGDISQLCFEPGCLDAIVNSSVLHHVTSYNGYDYDRAASALEAQVTQLAPGGCLIVRDFLASGPGQVELRIPQSLRTLWTTFAAQFRALLPAPQRGFAYEELEADERGWCRLRVKRRLAVEFLLRKDYLDDWDQEIQEEYTYFTQTDFEQLFARLGLRVLVSTPLHNPWIVKNRFEGQFEWFGSDGARLDYPPTNYLIVGEKVAAGAGVKYRSQPSETAPRFLRLASYRQSQTERTYDLVCRPHPTVDVLPFFRSETGNVSVLVRHSYPRPIVAELERSLDGLKPSPYVVEPVTAVQTENPLGETVETVLVQRTGLEPQAILRLWKGSVHYPSPGGIREEVVCCYAEVRPRAETLEGISPGRSPAAPRRSGERALRPSAGNAHLRFAAPTRGRSRPVAGGRPGRCGKLVHSAGWELETGPRPGVPTSSRPGRFSRGSQNPISRAGPVGSSGLFPRTGICRSQPPAEPDSGGPSYALPSG